MFDFAANVLNAKGPSIFSVGQAGYIIKSRSGQLLAIDLYLSDCVERLEGHKGFRRLLPQILSPGDLSFDAIVCTHPHYDHFDVDSVPEMMRKGSRLFCSVDCKKLVSRLQMEQFQRHITYVTPGDRYYIGDFTLLFVNCDHGAGAPDAVGIVVTVDGKTVYEVGDSCLRLDRTDEIPHPVDILIVPINGLYGNMDSDDAVIFAEALNPCMIIPCHYGMFASHGGDLKRFYDLTVEKHINALIMRQGEEYRL